MAVDTQQLMDEAEKLGRLVAQHPAVARYKSAQKSVADDAEAGRLLADMDRQIESLSRQEQSGMPISDAQRAALESAQSRVVSHIKIKNWNLAQVEFIDLLRKITQTIQRQLGDQPASGAGGAGNGGAAGAAAASISDAT
jgi:cell fate (sporulation/competence/biofilm development) regulator YlbF (YheA/YmcA/DUF963 family)